MDLESVSILLGVLALTAVSVLLIFKSFKNKSYEEVMAEQKQQNSALFATQHRPKIKDKKQKKAVKKVKEKKNVVQKETLSTEVSEESENVDAPPPSETVEVQKHHVEFKKPAVVEELAKDTTKRKPKKDTVRPILVNRDSSAENIQDTVEVEPANHFEESHPKDDFELLNSHLKEEVTKEKKKHKNTENEHIQQKNKKGMKHQTQETSTKPAEVIIEKKEEKEITIEATQLPPSTAVNATSAPAPPKEKKKKKSENLSALSDKQGFGLADLIPLVRKAEMSRVEVQILIDMLLNKQQDAPIVDDWSEGKGDPVQKLKKQVADKEKLLLELQETLTGTQMKLREIRNEQNTERTHLLQNIRDMEENVRVNKLERQGLENKYQNMKLKFQQMQEQYNEEAVKARKLLEEYTNLKMQTQQMELHLGKLQEAEVTIAQLRSELQELQNRRSLENHAAMENNMLVKKLQHQSGSLKEDLDKKEARIRELKDVNTKLEQQLALHLREEDELKAENAQIKTDIQRSLEETRLFEHNKAQEIQILRKAKEEIEQNNLKISNELKMLKSDLSKLEIEKKIVVEENTKLKAEISRVNDVKKNFEEEKSKWSEEISALREEKRRLLDDSHAIQKKNMNGSIEKDKQYKLEVQQLTEQLSLANQKIATIQENFDKEVASLKGHHKIEMDEQKNKNNELRQKNWKVVEALNAAESRFKSFEKRAATKIDVSRSTISTQKDEPVSKTAFLNRLLSNVKELDSLPQDKCEQLVTQFIDEYIRGNKKNSEDPTEVTRLRVQVADYKQIIDETESILSKLQSHITQEEIRWRNELKNKDESIIQLKQQMTQISNEKKPASSLLEVNNDIYEMQNHCTNGPDSTLCNSNGM